MTLGIGEDHAALHATARRWTQAHASSAVARAAMEDPPGQRPPFWGDLAGLGWLGLAVPEAHGGEGYGLPELAVVLEELGRVVAPGPFLPTVAVAAALARWGTDDQRQQHLPGLVDGSSVAAIGLPGAWRDGTHRPVLGAAGADLLLLPEPSTRRWRLVAGGDATVTPLASLDHTRPCAAVEASLDAADELLAGDDPLRVEDLVAVLVAAESVGVAAWCVETAAAHARERQQFGRPIGQFQAVKHRCADMLAELELARAAAWDAARGGDDVQMALAAAVAGALAPAAALRAARDCIQVLGGIGFTWEHDAHLYFRRATTMHLLLGGSAPWRARVVSLAGQGTRRHLAVDLPAEADAHRREVRAFVEELRRQPSREWNRAIADAGYLVPNWPEPWGRDAGAVEQLVIDEVLRDEGIRRPHLAVGAWALPTIIAHGTRDQQQRWIPPTLRGERTWCQMFSEPGAGSDLASLSTRAVRVEGGWELTGQKVWTTLAHQADWGICLARTDPEAPKHDGITCFVVDMRAEGLDIRPLRELTGAEMFNEVFLDGVFVPDDCVVGEVNRGWEAARTTLANERVSMGSGTSMGPGVEALVELAERSGALEDPRVVDTLGSVLADAQSLAVLGLRMTLRALQGAEPGPESSVRKLLGVLHDQRVQEVGLELLGPEGALEEGEAAGWIGGYLGNRSLSIAGGTSEIQRNVIAERLLGLPKDP